MAEITGPAARPMSLATGSISTQRSSTAKFGLQGLTIPLRSGWAYLVYLLLPAALTSYLVYTRRIQRARHREAELAIRTSEERLRLALWGSGDELWDWNVRSGEVFRVNTITGILHPNGQTTDPFEIMQQVLHPDDFAPAKANFDAHMRGDTPDYNISYRIRCEDNNWMWVRDRGRIVKRDAEGNPLRLAGTRQDIRPEKQAQAELHAADAALRQLNRELEQRVEERTTELRESNQILRHTLERLESTQKQLVEAEKMAALGDLVAGIAHEINTPLGIALSAASHLHDRTTSLSQHFVSNTLRRSDLDRYQHMALEASDLVMSNLQRASKLVGSFKLVAADQARSDRRTFNLSDYLDEIITSLQPKLRTTRHRIQISCPDELELDGFPSVLYQIVSNLVMNSLLHGFDSTGRGTVSIAISSNGDDIRMCYTDDGRGMPDSVSARVFEPFFTTKRGTGGTGLGMHIVYNLVHKALGGTIECTSQPDQGVTFTLQFPKQSPP